MTAEQWAARIQDVIRAAEADGYEVWIDDEFDGKRLEVRICSVNETDDALIVEWNA